MKEALMHGRLMVASAILFAAIGTADAADRPGAPGGASSVVSEDFLRKERARDATTPAKPLPKDRTVFRYTTKERAQEEAKHGLAPGTHMTARGGPGRPMSPEVAKEKYGLSARPDVRETLKLPADVNVRHNKVKRGAPGVGELTAKEKLPGSVVQKITPLHDSDKAKKR